MFFVFPIGVWAKSAVFEFTPTAPIQGEPVKVEIKGIENTSHIKSFTFDGKKFPVFYFDSKVYTVIPIDLNKKPGEYIVKVTLIDGSNLSDTLIVSERKKYKAPLGIPDSLGGNTPQAATKLVSNLTKDNTLLSSLWTNPKKLWTEGFKLPLSESLVTDPYGYSRETGAYNIAHKGTDFKAQDGTKVFSMNRGVVRLKKNLTTYGNTIVVDHGLGVQTFYMHLSKTFVSEGQLVSRGQLLGLSGHTGYAEGSHLHLSVRIDNVSIDPMKFLELFK